MEKLGYKVVSIVVIGFLLLVGVGMLSVLVSERMTLKESVEAEIASSSVKSQTFAGPVIVIPYTTYYYDKDSAKKSYLKTHHYYLFPEQLDITGELLTEERYRSIYKTNLYTFIGKLSGNFKIPEDFSKNVLNNTTYKVGEPYLALKMSDIRGIGNQTQVKLGSQTLDLFPLSGQGYLSEGVKGSIDSASLRDGAILNFNVDLSLSGTGSLEFTATGQATTVSLESAWPHPSFIGDSLPKERGISSSGFQAFWEVSKFSNITPKLLEERFETDKSIKVNSFGVSLIDPVDHYRQSDRAIKYAILFIALTFAGFFIFEIVRKVQIHPMQYTLVGIALLLFFLLLISLSEHLGFFWAYIIGSLLCISLISYYMQSALKNRKLSLIFTGLLILLYTVLYILLKGEAYSLLLGSLLLFFAIGSAMIFTKDIDWANLSSEHLEKVKKRSEPVEEEIHHEN
ncbi:cell envelope integrity protein CreD [Ignatzschineria sp. LJL83]